MNNGNQKIIGYDPQTGLPIYEMQNSQSQINYQQPMNNQTINSQSVNNINNKKNDKQSKLITVLIITNVITFILMSVFIVAFILKKPNVESINSENKTEENKGYTSTATNEPVSSDWKKYQFSIKGKTLSLPCSYQELSDISGFKMKSSDEKSYLESNSSTYVNLYINDSNNDQKLALYVDIKNDTAEDLQYSNTEVVSLWQSMYQVETNKAEKIIFPGNLSVGMEITNEQVIELFGEPTKIRDNSGYYTLTYNDDTTYTTINYYEIVLNKGVIEELRLDHKKNN